MAKSSSVSGKLPQPHLSAYGDSAVYLSYESSGYNAAITTAVQNLAATLRASRDWEDVVSGYDSLVASFNPAAISPDDARMRLEAALKANTKTRGAAKSKTIDVPVYYGGIYGADMEAIRKSSGLSEAAIIKAHSAQPYRICMMGFIPGFTFLSQAPKALHHSRHSSPRLSVPAGSVGIAGWQTGIYGQSSPGGWQIIGRTPLTIFDASRPSPFLWETGDYLRFVPQSGDFPEVSSEKARS